LFGHSFATQRSSDLIGVTAPEFFGTEVGRKFDVAIPLGTEPLVRGRESALDRRSTWWLRIMVRLKPGQSLEQAITALRGIQPQIREATIPTDYREEDKPRYLKDPFSLRPAATGTSTLRQRYEQPLTAMMWVVILVLLIACANIANLLLARGTSRRHELSVRVALGASRARILRQLLAESIILSLAGAIIGLVFAQWGSRMLVRQLSTTTNTVFLDLGIDWRVLGFTALVATSTALLFGIIPALRASRVQPNDALKEQGRAIAGERRFALGNLLVVWQVALSLILIVAAGLFIRTFSSLATLDLGFERRGILLANVNAQRLQTNPAERPALFRRIHDAALAVPGVQTAALSAVTPISGSTWQFGLEAIDGVPLDSNMDKRSVFVNLISADWFRTYGVKLLGGRDFTNADTTSSPPVAIVNEAFARKFLAGQNPVGHRLRQMSFPSSPGVEREIVGVVKDATYRSLREPMHPTMYLPYTQQQEPPPSISVSVRAAGGAPAALTKSLSDALTGVHKDLAISFGVIEEQVNASLMQERVLAMLSGFFGALALALAGLGLYGVTAYAVSRRRTEIGIRMALGAAPRGVVRMVLGRVALLVGIGIVVGLAASLAVAHRVATLLYGLEPRDPVTLALAAGVLAGIGALAGWIPAARASRIDPARVLRDG
jgi:predicted permease